MCFILLGGGGGSGVTTICLMQCNTSPSHRADQVVDQVVEMSSIKCTCVRP